MKFTPKRGIFRLIIAIAVIMAGLPLAKSYPYFIIYLLFTTIWLLFWLLGGFFDTD